MNDKTLIVIVGPTAVGKTAAAIKLALHFNTAIISADSRQFYREMSIGTAKPNAGELAAAKHYFINSHSVTGNFNVGDFETEGLKIISHIFETKDVAVMAGGSGLFVKAICDGFDELPTADPQIRERLNQELAEKGLPALQERLQVVDPDYYNEVDISNPQRVIRALEVFETSGNTFSSYRTGNKLKRPFNIIKIGLNLPREQLYTQINKRVDVMVEDGLVNEVNGLQQFRDLNALKTVGYTEIFDYLDGNTGLETAIALIKQHTRQFAKRQLTWFRKDESIIWINALEDDVVAVADKLISNTGADNYN